MIYCDHNATTPVRPEVLAGMLQVHPELPHTVEGLNALCNSEQEYLWEHPLKGKDR